jgi:predicted enzyme related to lactoylglutathione lyase
MDAPAMQSPEHDSRIDYIELPVADVEAAKAFYRRAFGWTFEDYGPDYASFHDGRLAGGFRKEADVRTGGPLVVLFAVDLAAAEARITQAGGRIVQPVFAFPGGRRFHFIDPSGHELAVWSDRPA